MKKKKTTTTIKTSSLKNPECATIKNTYVTNQPGSPKQNDLTVSSSKTTKLKAMM